MATDTFTAVVIEVNGLTAVVDDALIDDIKHFQEGCFDRDVFSVVGLEATIIVDVVLAPDFKC